MMKMPRGYSSVNSCEDLGLKQQIDTVQYGSQQRQTSWHDTIRAVHTVLMALGMLERAIENSSDGLSASIQSNIKDGQTGPDEIITTLSTRKAPVFLRALSVWVNFPSPFTSTLPQEHTIILPPAL